MEAIKSFTRTLKDSKLGFRIKKYRQERKYQIDASLTKDKAILDELIKSGLAIIPDFIPKEDVLKLHELSEAHLKKLVHDEYEGNKVHYLPHYGLYRIRDFNNVVSETNIFYKNSRIHDIAKAYISKDVEMYEKMAEIRPDVNVEGSSDYYHFDDWRRRLKVFLLLNDVGQEQAPMVYIKGSTAQGKWRERKDLVYNKYGKDAEYGHFFLHEINRLKEKHAQFKEVTCTGKAGTVIFADTRGIHKGTPLKSGKRVLLAGYFDC